MNQPKIDKPVTATQLRRRAVAQLNGHAKAPWPRCDNCGRRCAPSNDGLCAWCSQGERADG